LRDGKIFARGVADNKGQLIAHILAVKAWLQTRGELPLNVKMVFLKERRILESASGQLCPQNRDLLKADLIYTSDGPFTRPVLP
jgi:acetylornithine deacetylase/succinyl-diaminopimelate desuccinylase-like protein